MFGLPREDAFKNNFKLKSDKKNRDNKLTIYI